MESASNYWTEFPNKIFGCCVGTREHILVDDENINIEETIKIPEKSNNIIEKEYISIDVDIEERSKNERQSLIPVMPISIVIFLFNF
jgi:hypothetical protein